MKDRSHLLIKALAVVAARRQDLQREFAGFYRGGSWCRQYLKKPFVPQTIARLKYRGADYFRVVLSEQVKRLSLNWL